MTCWSLRAWLVGLLIGCACSLASARADAATFDVNPVRVALSLAAPSATLTVRNTSGEPLRLQIKAFAWDESTDGRMLLQPTTDLVFFPSFLVLAPGESRSLRIGGLPPTANERSYRVFLEELPSSPKGGAQGIRVLTRVGIPIFVQASAGAPHVVVDGVTRAPDGIRFRIHNAGTAYAIPKRIDLVVRDADGRIKTRRSMTGWYVLANHTREHSIELGPNECRTGDSITVEVETDEGRASARLDGSCAP